MKKIAISLFVGISAFAAGYLLPNGTIVYDGSSDPTVYKVEKVSIMQNQNSFGKPKYSPEQVVTVQHNEYIAQESYPIQTKSVIIEDRTVVYEKPVYIQERIYNRNPVYDIVDLAGTILVYGLLYDGAKHAFYHHELHRGHRYDRYKHRR